MYLFGLTSSPVCGRFRPGTPAKQVKRLKTNKLKDFRDGHRTPLGTGSDQSKVASGYACIDNTPLEATSALREGLLREIDERYIKASFDSLDKVIATQLQNVSSHHKQSGHRLHAYQNIVAAGSGVFTGFFTYEVGESVLKFIHASQFADDRSPKYGCSAKAGYRRACKARAVAGTCACLCPWWGKHTLSPARANLRHHRPKHQQARPALSRELRPPRTRRPGMALDHYHLLVTWFAGYIGWHKPHDEHGGGHGHHG